MPDLSTIEVGEVLLGLRGCVGGLRFVRCVALGRCVFGGLDSLYVCEVVRIGVVLL